MKFPLRVSINIPVTGELLAYVLRQNGRIAAAGFSEIDFNATRTKAIPHITLIMGHTNSEMQLEKLKQMVTNLAQSFSPFTFEISKPYVAVPGRRFCFLDILGSGLERFYDLKRAAAIEMEGLLSFDFHGGPKNPPHITIGYFNQPQENLNQYQLDPYNKPSEALSIAFSLVGNRGTCIENLQVCEFFKDCRADVK